MEKQFELVVNQLVEEVEGLRNSIGSLLGSAAFNSQFNNFLLFRFLEEKGERIDDEADEKIAYKVGPPDFGELRRLDRKFKSAKVAETLLPGSLLVTLVSRYDAFLGRLIRTMMLARPELLKSSERTLSFSDLLELGDYDSAREYMIEKEIESVLRKSHVEHFQWLENKLDMQLRKNLPSWSAFMELTERRNLLVHCDGIVSHQYISNCKNHSVPLENCCVGDKLDAPIGYYRSSCDCIVELSVKLTHVIWRKLLPGDLEAADEALNSTCFELLIHENYSLANELLRFAYTVLKKHASEKHKVMFLVNFAQSYKWLGDDKECTRLLGTVDWSAKGIEFQLCVSVLRDEYAHVAALMRRLGASGQITSESYREWPLFRKARKEQIFQEAYKEVFGEDMKLGEKSSSFKARDLKEFVESLMMKETESVEENENATSKIDGNMLVGMRFSKGDLIQDNSVDHTGESQS